MYRIIFDTKVGVWRIQISSHGIFWSNICDAGKVRGWPNVKACEEFITNTGLSDIYRNYHKSAAHSIFSSHPQRSYEC